MISAPHSKGVHIALMKGGPEPTYVSDIVHSLDDFFRSLGNRDYSPQIDIYLMGILVGGSVLELQASRTSYYKTRKLIAFDIHVPSRVAHIKDKVHCFEATRKILVGRVAALAIEAKTRKVSLDIDHFIQDMDMGLDAFAARGNIS